MRGFGWRGKPVLVVTVLAGVLDVPPVTERLRRGGRAGEEAPGCDASTGFGSFSERASVSQEQKHGEAEGERAAYQEVDADGIFVQERLIHAEGLYQETTDGVKAHVKQ
jgi:hypothetical protein